MGAIRTFDWRLSPMKRLFLLLLFPAALVAQTSQTARIVEGTLANRPTVCANGDYYVATDQNPVVEYKCTANAWNAESGGGGGLSGMTAGQVPIAATATTVTSSKPIQGSADANIMGAGTVSRHSSKPMYGCERGVP
jgi:hypothetical protein